MKSPANRTIFENAVMTGRRNGSGHVEFLGGSDLSLDPVDLAKNAAAASYEKIGR